MESKGIAAAAWRGQAKHPRLLRLPTSLLIIMLGFYLTVILVLVGLFTQLSRGHATLSWEIDEVVITNCFVETTCEFRFALPLTISHGRVGTSTVFAIDGGTSEKCYVQLCLEEGERKQFQYNTYLQDRLEEDMPLSSAVSFGNFTMLPLRFTLRNAVLRVAESTAAPMRPTRRTPTAQACAACLASTPRLDLTARERDLRASRFQGFPHARQGPFRPVADG